MKTAINRFDYSVWFVLDKIRDYMLPNKRVISYYFDANVTRIKPISHRDELRAIEYLIERKVIRELSEPDTVESGEPGTKDYSVHLNYHFKVNRSFFDYHKTYKLKVFSKRPNNSQQEFIKKQVFEFVESKKLGKKQGKLLRLLAGLKPIRKSILESKTKTENLIALVRDTRKSLKQSPYEILLVRSDSFSKENSYKLAVIS